MPKQPKLCLRCRTYTGKETHYRQHPQPSGKFGRCITCRIIADYKRHASRAVPRSTTVEGHQMFVFDHVVQATFLLQNTCYDEALRAGWHYELGASTLRTSARNNELFPTRLCLIHSEISEAMEGHRKGLMDDKLPHRPMAEVELADALIRICDLAGAMKYDLAGAVAEKLAYNRSRADHKPEARLAEGGKSY